MVNGNYVDGATTNGSGVAILNNVSGLSVGLMM